MKALIIVDMLKDFVDGKLANPKAQEMIPRSSACSTTRARTAGSSSSRTTPISPATPS